MTNDLCEAILRDASLLAQQVIERMERTDPDVFQKYRVTRAGRSAREWCAEDTVHHLEHLSAALSVGDDNEFSEYRSWLVRMLGARNIPEQDIDVNFEALANVLGEHYGPEAEDAISLLRKGELRRNPRPA